MEKSSFSEFQVKQMYEMLMDMLLRDPELLNSYRVSRQGNGKAMSECERFPKKDREESGTT